MTILSNSTANYLTTSTGSLSTTGTIVTNSTSTNVVYLNNSNLTVCNGVDSISINHSIEHKYDLAHFDGLLEILSGSSGEIIMPDGSKIVVDSNGNYEIYDKDAKITYKANLNRAFNCYVNASELLSDFVKDLGSIGVTQDKVLKTPIEFFINWLIHKAADQDDDELAKEGVPTLEDSRMELPPPQLRCRFCQRYLSKSHEQNGMNYCNPDHMKKYAEKIGMNFN